MCKGSVYSRDQMKVALNVRKWCGQRQTNQNRQYGTKGDKNQDVSTGQKANQTSSYKAEVALKFLDQGQEVAGSLPNTQFTNKGENKHDCPQSSPRRCPNSGSSSFKVHIQRVNRS